MSATTTRVLVCPVHGITTADAFGECAWTDGTYRCGYFCEWEERPTADLPDRLPVLPWMKPPEEGR